MSKDEKLLLLSLGVLMKQKKDFISVVFNDESGFSYDQIVHISQLKEIEYYL